MQLDGFLHPQGYGHDENLPAGGSGGPCVLWAWNGVDTTQFAAAPLLPTDTAANTIAGAPALTVVADNEGNRLRMAVAGLAQLGPIIWPIAAIEGLVLPARYVARFSMIDSSPFGGGLYSGVYYYCDGEVALGASHGIAFTSLRGGNRTLAGIETDGTYDFIAPPGGALFAGAIQPNVIELEIRGQKSGNDPGAVVSSTQSGGSSAIAGTVQELNNATYFNGFPASWDALTMAVLSQFGIAMHLVAAEDDPFVEFGMIEVLSHPLDWT